MIKMAIGTYLSIITWTISEQNALIKRYREAEWIKNKTRERWILYGIRYRWNLKNNTNESIYKTETDSEIEHKRMVTKGERREWEGQIYCLQETHFRVKTTHIHWKWEELDKKV